MEREHKVQDLFKIVKSSTEREEYIIIIGNHLATEAKFNSREEAEEFIESKDYDLIFALIAAFLEGKEATEQAILEKQIENPNQNDL